MTQLKDAFQGEPDKDRETNESRVLKGMETMSSSELSLTLEDTDGSSENEEESLPSEVADPEWFSEFISPSKHKDAYRPQWTGKPRVRIRYFSFLKNFRYVVFLSGAVLALLLINASVSYLAESGPKEKISSRPLDIPAKTTLPKPRTEDTQDPSSQPDNSASKVISANGIGPSTENRITTQLPGSTRSANTSNLPISPDAISQQSDIIAQGKTTSSEKKTKPKNTSLASSAMQDMPHKQSRESNQPRRIGGNGEKAALLKPDLDVPKKPKSVLPSQITTSEQSEQAKHTDFGEKNNLAPTSPDMINFSANHRGNHSYQQLKTAYRDYLNGNYDQAVRLYSSVLSRKPKNRDALLGLAAIATKQGRLLEARRLYRQLLEDHPKDEFAQISLMGLQETQDPIVQISRIKEMLRRRPGSPQLYFKMGLSYSTLSRWGDAQRAFFQAFNLDNQNPNYAYNLAVSLDRLGKTASAISYYQQALRLTESKPVNFTPSAVKMRLKQLYGNHN